MTVVGKSAQYKQDDNAYANEQGKSAQYKQDDSACVHQPGKWLLIVDLSAPKGSSVNDSIPIRATNVVPFCGFLLARMPCATKN